MPKLPNKILETLKSKKTGVFIDDANLFYAKKKVGCQIDFKKLKNYLGRFTKILFINYHIAIPVKSDAAFKPTQQYIAKIKPYVTVKIKPLKYIKSGGVLVKKGDVDLEIAIDVMRNINEIDAIIIVSGDSDYIELRKFLIEQKKQVIFMAFRENMAWEIKKGKYLFLNKIREFIELK